MHQNIRLEDDAAGQRRGRGQVLGRRRDEARPRRNDGLGLEDPTRLFFHCFGMPDSDRLEFICLPDGDGLVIDTFTYEEYGESMTSGPLAGKRLKRPVPDTDDWEQNGRG